MRRTRIPFIFALVTLTIVAATLPATSQTTGSDKTYIMALDQSEAKTLDPGHGFEFMSFFIDSNTYDQLLAHKGANDLNTFVPMLATEWKISADGKEYTFKLRPNVKFASGNPFTRRGCEVQLDAAQECEGQSELADGSATDVVVVDPLTIKMVLNDPFADWLAVMAGPSSSILDSKLAKEHGASDAATADKDDKGRSGSARTRRGVVRSF